VADLLKTIDKQVVVPLKVEGVTTKHPAAKSARAAETAIRRLGVFLKEELDAANAEHLDQAGDGEGGPGNG
jgi:hypothetical protein